MAYDLGQATYFFDRGIHPGSLRGNLDGSGAAGLKQGRCHGGLALQAVGQGEVTSAMWNTVAFPQAACVGCPRRLWGDKSVTSRHREADSQVNYPLVLAVPPAFQLW